MKLLKPNNISGEIMTLLDEADEKVVIVSPYCKIDKWFKLLKKIKSLQDRNIHIEFYVRDGVQETIEQVLNIGIEPILIPNLHAKIYMNEKTAIVTSMNLLLYSDINSLDIGYKTDTIEEYNELVEFYNRNIKLNSYQMNDPELFDWRNHIYETLNKGCGKTRIYEENGGIKIYSGGNQYNSFIWNDRKNNFLRISGILSGAEFDFIESNLDDIQKNSNIAFELQKGIGNYYSQIFGTLSPSIDSSVINNIRQKEETIIANSIIEFILVINKIKEDTYTKTKNI